MSKCGVKVCENPARESSEFCAEHVPQISFGPAKNRVVGYKIRRSDGKYSTGGGDPEFTHVGKTWSNKAGLHSHFAVIEEAAEAHSRARKKGYSKGQGLRETYRDCTLVLLTESDHVGIESYFEALGR